MTISPQEIAVVQYIRKHGSITQMEATAELGITRLAAVICSLKKKGLAIRSEEIKVPSRYGTARVARYFI